MIRAVLSFALLFFLSTTISGQPRVSPRNLHERLLVITRYTGDIEAEFRKYKARFDLSRFSMDVQ
jgi:hypothetical protein